MSDDYDDGDFEEEDFQESPEVNALSKYEEIVFCPDCDLYMPYQVDGAIVRRKCPRCHKLFEGGHEVAAGQTPTRRAPAKARNGAPKRAAKKSAPSKPTAKKAPARPDQCAATTKAGSPCSNAPRAGSKYCASHKGWRPPRK